MVDPILITDITSNVVTDSDNVVTGTGVFDAMMETVNAHVIAQYDAGRIKANDFSTVYLGALQSTLQEAMTFVLQKTVAEKNANVLVAQESLYQRQRQGFDDNKYQKILETALNAWGVTYQDVATPSIPDAVITTTGINGLFERAQQQNV